VNVIACTGIAMGMEAFGEVLLRRRRANGWGRMKLSRKVGLNHRLIRLLEEAEVEPTDEQRIRLGAALGVSPDEDGGWWQ
jgi:ribosome-binding protein aMBF1 (putative translation factor)